MEKASVPKLNAHAQHAPEAFGSTAHPFVVYDSILYWQYRSSDVCFKWALDMINAHDLPSTSFQEFPIQSQCEQFDLIIVITRR